MRAERIPNFHVGDLVHHLALYSDSEVYGIVVKIFHDVRDEFRNPTLTILKLGGNMCHDVCSGSTYDAYPYLENIENLTKRKCE